MKLNKYLLNSFLILFVFWIFGFVGKSPSLIFTKAANTGNVNLSGTVLQYIALDLTAGSSIDFGNMTPGVPKCSTGNGTVAAVSTSAANGYVLDLSDGSDTNSAMTHTDTTTKIPDMSGSIGTPISWSDGVTIGVGVTLYSADTTKEAKWGTGTTACDANNKWAGVPASITVGHSVTSYHSAPDVSSWGWKVDSSNAQKTGVYSGNVLFTTTANL